MYCYYAYGLVTSVRKQLFANRSGYLDTARFFYHLGPAFQCKLLQDVEIDNSEEVSKEAEDQESDHAIMRIFRYFH